MLPRGSTQMSAGQFAPRSQANIAHDCLERFPSWCNPVCVTSAAEADFFNSITAGINACSTP